MVGGKGGKKGVGDGEKEREKEGEKRSYDLSNFLKCKYGMLW